MTTVAGRRRLAGTRELQVDPRPAPSVPSAPLDPSDGSPRTEVLSHDSEPVRPEPAGAADEGARTAVRRRRRPSLLTTALAACLAALVVAAALSMTMARRDRADLAAGDAALATARTSAATILSYDYRQLDSDFAAATALTTGTLRTDYQATTSKAVAQLATQTHAVVSAKVVAGGVVSSTTTRATVLLFVDQTTTSNRLEGPKVDENRVQLTLRKVGAHWLVSGLQAL